MPEIAAIRGYLYNPEKAPADKVAAPPYDVIDAKMRDELAKRDKHNCVHVILPEGEGDKKYANAAARMNKWIDDGVLVKDFRPALYRYHQQFELKELDGRRITRKGFICAVRLHDFSEGMILPHERTLKGPKIDRLKLMEATGCHSSQIFGMYSDAANVTDKAFKECERKDPDINIVTDDGTRHIPWKMQDSEKIGDVKRFMGQTKVYIADGHHRYETMLALRDKWRAQQADGFLPSKSTGEFATMFLCNMTDEGMVVFPTHRMMHGLKDFNLDDMLAKADAYFSITKLEGMAKNMVRVRSAVAKAGVDSPSFAVVAPKRDDAWLLSYRAGVNLAQLGVVGSGTFVHLDVTLLHELIIDRTLGVDKAAQEAKTNIKYIKDTTQALERTAAGEGQVTFIMNPTRLDQVRAVADHGEFMPQKSTYFFPKIATGLVFNKVDPDEHVP